jgi:L-aminopeptidase/D-esterase-like protein
MVLFDAANFNDLPEFACAHVTDVNAGTGCTVFVAPDGASCGVDVRGGGPATRETDLLRAENMVQKVHAVVLSGGSAFGLESASGVANVLAERGFGFKVGPVCVPIVPAACLFDLVVGQNKAPGVAMGEEATRLALKIWDAQDASLDCSPKQGNVGAGCGATVGKLGHPGQVMKSGFGWAGVRAGDLVVIASVAVNAAGNVYDFDGSPVAGVLDVDGHILDSRILSVEGWKSSQDRFAEGVPSANTTLGVVLTNAKLDKAQATKVSQITQDAYARRIMPVHTLGDGDSIFTMASCKVDAPTDVVAVLATEAMEHAIVAAVMHADSAYGMKSAKEVITQHKH